LIVLYYTYNIDLRVIGDMQYLLSHLQHLYKLVCNDVINITISLPSRVKPEYLVAIVGIIKYIKVKGIVVNITIDNPTNNTYSQRINFYKELDIPCEEDFNRWDANGRFVEITNFDRTNNVDISNAILRVIRDNCRVDTNTMKCLNYCFFEMVDNIDNHADSPINGYTVVQNFNKRNELTITILDAGKGIHESLTENPRYTHFAPADSLIHCIKENVTNGRGRGVGLYHTAQFILENGGQLGIYSGENYLEIRNGQVNLYPSAYWQGTLLHVIINKSCQVNFANIFGDSIPVTVQDSDMFIDDLW
jgi:anti-sigma regulatory factor (Ser/Thr protein kinase)